MTLRRSRFAILLALSLAAGCSGSLTSTGGFGATPGGVQDMSFARGLVEKGQVPPPEAILVEGMFSEHDLPLAGPPCTQTLCLRGAAGVAPNASGSSAAWVQIGMSSDIDPDTYERPPLAIIATVDVSGSMSWDSGPGTPGGIAESLLHSITGELDAGDRFAMVTYGSSVDVSVGWTAGDDASIPGKIDDLHENGSTDMESGLQKAFELAQQELGKGREVRVLLFTDAQPNVGATSSTEFEGMASAAANAGIGLTVFGVGLGMGVELVTAMSHLHGGNAFSFPEPKYAESFMADNWPWFSFPIAYDLTVDASPSAGVSIAASHGFPPVSEGAPPSSSLEVSSVFLSKKRGALLLELHADHPLAAGDGADLSLSYVDTAGQLHEEDLAPAYDGAALDERGVAMPGDGIARAVSLALFTSELKRAAELYATDETGAAAVLEAALARLDADAAATGDPDLANESTFWAQLLVLMQAGAPQGDLYGSY